MRVELDALLRSVGELRDLLDRIGPAGASEAAELITLDRLVRRYPAAARMSLRLHRCPENRLAAPPGWSPAGDHGDLPLWRWLGGAVHVATGDLDQLRFLGVALSRFDRMTADELRAYLGG